MLGALALGHSFMCENRMKVRRPKLNKTYLKGLFMKWLTLYPFVNKRRILSRFHDPKWPVDSLTT